MNNTEKGKRMVGGRFSGHSLPNLPLTYSLLIKNDKGNKPNEYAMVRATLAGMHSPVQSTYYNNFANYLFKMENSSKNLYYSVQAELFKPQKRSVG